MNEGTEIPASLSVPRKAAALAFSLGFQADHEATEGMACNTASAATL